MLACNIRLSRTRPAVAVTAYRRGGGFGLHDPQPLLAFGSDAALAGRASVGYVAFVGFWQSLFLSFPDPPDFSRARMQDALSWELRAATSLARLWRDQGRPAEGMALLQSVYGRFTEGFETADLRAAKARLEILAEPNALRTRIS